MSPQGTSTGAERSDRSHGYFALKPFGPIPDYGVLLWVALGLAIASIAVSRFAGPYGSIGARGLGFRRSSLPPEAWFMLGPALFAAIVSGFVLRFAFDRGLGKHCLTLVTLALFPAQLVILAGPLGDRLILSVVSALALGPPVGWLTLREESVWPGVGLHYIANAGLTLCFLR